MSDIEDSEDSESPEFYFLYGLSLGINKGISRILNSNWFLKDINKWDKYSFEIYGENYMYDVDLTFLEKFGLYGHQYSSGNIRVYVDNYPVQNNYYNRDYYNRAHIKIISRPVIFLNDAFRTILLQRRGILKELIPMLLDMIRFI